MRIEVQNWLRQAEADLTAAKNLIASEDFYLAVFSSQQATEKALKSLSLFKHREIPRGHSIIFLAKNLDVPEQFMSGLRDLNPEYLITRYPDMAEGVPAELYDRKIATRHFQTAQEVVLWVKSQMNER